MGISKKTIIIEIVILFVLLLIFGGSAGSVFKPTLNLIDEGQFAAWAYQMMHGKTLYGDIYTTYGPLYTYPLYVLFTLISPDPFIIRVYLLFGVFVGGLSCLYLSYRLGIRFAFRIILIVCVAVLPIITFRQAGGLLGLVLFVEGVTFHKRYLVILSGVVTALTFLISPEIALFLILVVCFYIFYFFVTTNNVKRIYIHAVDFIAGCLTVITPFVYVTWNYGVLASYFKTTIDVFVSFSGSNVPNGQNFPSMFHVFFENASIGELIKSVASYEALLYYVMCFYIFSGLYLLYQWIVKPSEKHTMLVLGLTLFGLLLYTVVLSRSGIGHFYFILPPVILLLLFFAQRLTFSLKSKIFMEKAVSGIILFIIGVFFFRLFMIYRFEIISSLTDIQEYTSEKPLTEYTTMYHSSDEQRVYFDRMRLIINRYTSSSETIFFLSDNPMMYLITERMNPTRYDLPYIANTIQKRYEIISDLEEKKPSLVVYDTSVWEVDGISNKKRLPEVYTYILDNYQLVSVVNGIEVYTLQK